MKINLVGKPLFRSSVSRFEVSKNNLRGYGNSRMHYFTVPDSYSYYLWFIDLTLLQEAFEKGLNPEPSYRRRDDDQYFFI